MTLVFATSITTGAVGSLIFDPRKAWDFALWYAAIQAITSYFCSGVVKLFSADWRSGRALTYFLDGGLYGPLRPNSTFRRFPVARLCSWAFILWECAFPFVLLARDLAILWCCIAAVFHLLVFIFFSLNRFFWAWVAMFPAIIYCSGRL